MYSKIKRIFVGRFKNLKLIDMGRYINPFTDWGFKRLFGQEFSKDLLINFLNDLFEGEFQIKDVTFKDKELLGESNDLRGCFEKWIYVLKHMEALERLPFTAQKKIFNHLAKLADIRCMSSEEQEKYDESVKAVDDYYSGLYGSYMEGEENGRAEGRAEGELSKGLSVARNLLAMGMTLPQIMKATGLNERQLKQLLS